MLKSVPKIWFTSDTHFGHANIIKYCSRPWASVDEMNEGLIENWNLCVGADDEVWHLGDFYVGPNGDEKIPLIRRRLNGRINLVLGNHDADSVKYYYDMGFDRVYDKSVVLNDFCILSHAPMNFVKAPFFNIYGHVHDCATYNTYSEDSCCVCVERHAYRPVSWEEIVMERAKLIEQ